MEKANRPEQSSPLPPETTGGELLRIIAERLSQASENDDLKDLGVTFITLIDGTPQSLTLHRAIGAEEATRITQTGLFLASHPGVEPEDDRHFGFCSVEVSSKPLAEATRWLDLDRIPERDLKKLIANGAFDPPEDATRLSDS